MSMQAPCDPWRSCGDLYGTIAHLPAWQHELARNVLTTGRRHDALTGIREQPQCQAPLPVMIEFGEYIIDQERRADAAMIRECLQLKKPQRNGGGALLSGRSVVAQRVAAEAEHDVITVRTDVCLAP